MRYGGFWRRFCASLIDGLFLLPITILLIYMQGASQQLGVMLALPSAILFALYTILSHWLFGATLGKKLMKLCVVTAYAERSLGFSHAFRRGMVYLFFSLIVGYVQVVAYQSISSADYIKLAWYMREGLTDEYSPSWYSKVEMCWLAWTVLSMLSLIVSPKKRALHDYLGGTIVLKTRDSGSMMY